MRDRASLRGRARLRAWAVACRYGLPARLGGLLPAPTAAVAARWAAARVALGQRVTLGFFHRADMPPAAIASANLAAVRALAGVGAAAPLLAVKAPPLGFDAGLLAELAAEAGACGVGLVFDAHAAHHADATLAAMEKLAGGPSATGAPVPLGLALPARWRRSLADARRLRDMPVAIRLVKGEWADPAGEDGHVTRRFMALAGFLAGRAAPVAVASHDADLAACALDLLQEGATPCELEQLRGLPMRQTAGVARARGVPLRTYLPFGPGWWPYALERALARPGLGLWFLKDWLAA
ncbi:MAG TPA: proline dehydrogenase [Novosphingobium sp.]|nr:proline dehydrogenase [Novosphingobium sp.]